MDNSALLHTILGQIDAALNKWEQLSRSRTKSEWGEYYKIPTTYEQEIITTLASTIERLAPNDSRYHQDAQIVLDLYRKAEGDNPSVIDRLAGILKALRADYEAGYLQSVQELLHTEIFANFLEMADYFLEQEYKDPAGVMAGGVLEEHLRKLCLKNGLPIEDILPSGNKPKMAGRLNDDLAAQNVYSKLDQKSITAWVDLRNKAAHGKYTEYTIEQVKLMVQGIRDFITRNPA